MKTIKTFNLFESVVTFSISSRSFWSAVNFTSSSEIFAVDAIKVNNRFYSSTVDFVK